jgi:hypothetical protein
MAGLGEADMERAKTELGYKDDYFDEEVIM